MNDNLGKIMEKIKKPAVEDEITDDLEESEEKNDQKVEQIPTEVKKVDEDASIKQNSTKTEQNAENDPIIEQKLKEVEMLQNNGVFRAELLYQLSQINQNLLVFNSMIHKQLIGDEDEKKE